MLGSAIMVPVLVNEYYAPKNVLANVLEDLERQLPDLPQRQSAELPKCELLPHHILQC